jgi:hypothetical protein
MRMIFGLVGLRLGFGLRLRRLRNRAVPRLSGLMWMLRIVFGRVGVIPLLHRSLLRKQLP